jgi:hypothetical protein
MSLIGSVRNKTRRHDQDTIKRSSESVMRSLCNVQKLERGSRFWLVLRLLRQKKPRKEDISTSSTTMDGDMERMIALQLSDRNDLLLG